MSVQILIYLRCRKLVFTCSTRNNISQNAIPVSDVQTDNKLHIVLNSFLERAG